ncbi:iron chelate uptake ABC transporter family permease subunit [Actinotignum sanguinis]|uniref:FecCD family ABC transporter permease n=1 Tax=Actinotignum sanguinis TaxID=1445614 RepID=UPI001F498692|nr:iron chelate uptake ABC transporter family permease subunit [Actinotignum sanguinis]MDY5148992.1 iron chelate uptake ABC transporter family permease subunit [Actinotignum sanguinis]
MNSTVHHRFSVRRRACPASAHSEDHRNPDRTPAAPGRTIARRRTAALIAGVIAVLVLAILSICIGARPISPGTLFTILSGADRDSMDAQAVLTLRPPRTIAAIAIGAALGVAGALIQAISRNPLAEPGILGVSAGAGFAVTLAIAVAGISRPSIYMWWAVAGALLATAAVLLIGSHRSGRADPVRLILAGVALSAVLNGIVGVLRLADPRTFNEILVWTAGTLENRTWEVILPVLPLLALGLIVAAALTPALNIIALGDDAARALGAHVTVIRLTGVAAMTVLTGGAVAIAGPISFIGLMAPHAIRSFAGADQRWIVGLSALWAPALLLAADILARIILPTGELPVSVMCAFLGAPVLIYLVRRRKAFTL